METKGMPVAEKRADTPRWTPPKWMNRWMTWLLKTPGLQRIFGKGTALLTFTGRKTGEKTTMPVSYAVSGDRILISGHRSRRWWQNLVVNPDVELRLAGKVRSGKASVMEDPDNALADFVELLQAQPMIAKVNDISMDHGEVDEGAAREALESTVVVSIKLED